MKGFSPKHFWLTAMRLHWAVGVALLTGVAHAQALAPLEAGGFRGCDARVAAMPALGSAPASVTDYFLWRTMTQGWNARRTHHQQIIRDRLASMRLHDISVSLPPAPFNQAQGDVCSFFADPGKKNFQLKYRARGNRMSARHNKPLWRDPKVSGTFVLEVDMFFTTTGPGGEPVVLQGSTVAVRDFIFTGSSHLEAQSDGRTFAQQTFPDAGVGAFVAVDANRFFRLLLANQVIGSVTPGRRSVAFRPRLFFDVKAARPSVGVGIIQQ